MGESEIHVVATKHQVVADADARQLRLAVLERHLDQRQVRRAAADIANKQQPRTREFLGEALLVAEKPVIEGRLRLFEQAQMRQAGLSCGFERQRARTFVERRGNRQDHLLLFEWRFREAVPPGGANMREIAGAGGDRRDLGDIVFGTPGQDRRHPVDRGVRQPALGAGDQATRNLGAKIERQAAGERRFAAVLSVPRQLQIAWAEFPGCRVEADRRQQRPRGNLAGSDQLLDLEQLDLLFSRRRVGDDGVAGAEIDADDVRLLHGLPETCRHP